MDVKTVDEADRSVRRWLVYGAATIGLATIVLAPLLLFDQYLRVLSTLLLLGLLGFVGRTLLAGVAAFRPPRTPELDLSDAELPSVNVVIPAYNEAPVLSDTIEACRNLDYPADKLEVVLCYEAASTDGTAEICEQAAADDERFVAVERDEPGGGKAKATNYALRHTSHDLIASIDADHCFKSDAIRRAVAWFESDEDIWCLKGRCYGTNAGDSLIAAHATLERHIAEKADLFAREVFGGLTIFGGGQAFFRREVFDELGVFDEDVLVEDIDMSVRIHSAGKRLVMDPSIVTFEENPPTLAAWWSQRARWARGWMQVAVRYLHQLPRDSRMGLGAKLDSVMTFSFAILPAFVIFALPVAALGLLTDAPVNTYLPYETALWGLVLVSPLLVSVLIFAQDRRDGLEHHPHEYLAAFTLWLYLLFQTVVYLVAFIDEFVLNKPSVYVTTSRSGS